MREYNFSGRYSAQPSAVAPIYKTKEDAEKEKNKGGLIGGLGYLGEKVAAGFLQSTEGIVDYTVGGLAKLFGADAFAEEVFRDDWFGDWYTNAGEWYNASGGWKTAGDVFGGIGTSLPSLAATAGAVAITAASGGTAAPLAAKLLGAAGIGAAGLGAAGTSTKEAYRKTGELTEKELLYGLGSGVVEGGTEALTNALTLGGGAVAKNIGKMLGKEVTETVARKGAIKSLAGAFAGEAFEEGFSEFVNPYIARATYDADAEDATLSEIGYSALIGGLSGMVMEGANIGIDTANSFTKGTNLAARGLDGEVMELSARIAAFEDANKTENEAFEAVAETYKKLSESLEATGGKVTTVSQKKMLGDLSRANVAAVFSPMITRSAANIYQNAEAMAERLNAYGYTDENGKPMTYTVDEIRAGIDPNNRRSFRKALQENTVLRTLATADVTGHLVMDTNKFKDAALRGKQIASRADLWRFAETATSEEIRAVSEALGIDNWETLTEDEFENKVAAFVQSGGADRYAAEAKEAERIFADASSAAALPKVISLADGETRRYATADGDIAISRKGEEYRIYDYGTRTNSRAMSRAEVNKALAEQNVRGQEVFTGAKDYAEKTAEIKRNTQEADEFAREHVKGYAELSSSNKTMVRKVIRAAKAAGMSDADAATYATVSAHAGLDIVFSKQLCRVDGGYADGFYDPAKNRIVVNPEGTRSAESLLLHELDHAVRSGIRKDGGTKMFTEAVFSIPDEAAQKITARYKNVESDVSKTELIWDEANAYFAETFFANKGVLESLTAKVPTIKERILAFLEGAKTDYAGTPKLEGTAKRYYKQYKKMFDEFAERNRGRNAEEARREGKIGDARFSLQFADVIAADQRKFVTDGKGALTKEELELAIEQTAEMVAIMSEHKDILPEDKTGRTLVKNGSYDYSVENTTICVRTLAYNSFTDMVSEKIGRPLSQMESFLVSQKLYEIAKEPQCLYCYVSLDRKAYNEMILRYITQRDEAIAEYKLAGKPKLPADSVSLEKKAEWPPFKKFLAGRKPTTQMWQRYKAWTELATKGEYIVNASDVATESKRADLARKNDGRAAQVKDMLKYAQSASWAKKQTQYVAYFDDIRKLSPAVIKNLNKHYGLRWYSFSDYSGAFIVENMQQVTDAALRGLKGLAYTKDTDYARIFAPTGMNINISVYAKKTENGYAIDEKQSANIEEAIELRKQFPNVGIVVVATDADGVEWALNQKWSDVVIPFHTVRTGADVADFYKWEIFNAEQNDTVSDENLWNAYVESVSGGNARAAKKVSKMIYPSEHQNNRETYMRLLKERGLTPRFKSFLGNPNYMKLVNETRQSEAETKPLTATYDLDAAKKSFDKFVKKGGYFEGWYNDGIDVDAEASIVASDIAAGRKANEVGYGRQDTVMPDRRKVREHGRRYALPDDDGGEFGIREALDVIYGDDKLIDEVLADMEKSGAVFDPEGIIARGAPTTPESTKAKIHTRARAYMVLDGLADNNLLSNKSRAEFLDTIYRAMNGLETQAEKKNFAREAAEFYVARLLTEAKTDNPAVLPAHRRLSWLNIGAGKISFSPSDIAELKAVLGKEEMRKILGRWGKKRSGTPEYMLDMFINEVSTTIPGMAYIGKMHTVDALLELDRMYEEARKTITDDKYISAYWDSTDDDINAMVKNAEDAIINGIEAQDKAITEGKLEATQELADTYKREFDTLRGTIRYRGYIAARVEKLTNMKKGAFQNASIYKDDTFDKILSKLTSIEWRKSIAVNHARAVMKDISAWYSKENALLGYVDEENPGYYDKDMAEKMAALSEGKGSITATELKELDQVLGYLTKFIETYNKVYIGGKWVDAKPIAERYVGTMREGGKLKKGFFREIGRRYLGAFGDVESVMRYYDRYRKDGFYTEMFAEMRKAAIDADVQTHRIMSTYEDFMQKHKNYLKDAEHEIVEFMGVKMPKMTAISLYMTMSREQAHKGLAVSGFKFTDAQGESVRVEGFATNTELTEAALLSVVAQRQKELYELLSNTDREYIKILEKGYNEDARKLKADRDLERYGFTNVTNDKYYPIRRANTAKSVDTSFSAELDRVSNASFNKDIVKGAAGELFIQNADTLYRNHVRAVCQYAALSPAIEAYNKLYNMDITGNPNKPVSVKTQSENIWKDGNTYFRDLIGDIQGIPRDRGEKMGWLGKMRGRYAKFQLGANPKTVVTQTSSIFAATSVLDLGSVMKVAKFHGVSGKDVDTYCSLAMLRNTDNTAAMAQGVLTRGERISRGIDTVSDTLMAPIGWMDRAVIKKLFAACQLQVQKNGGAKAGTEQNKVEAGKLLEKVILETQQNSFATERSAAMRSGNEIYRTLTMFSADAMKVTARVLDSFGEASAIRQRMKTANGDAKKALASELKIANKKLGKSIFAMVTVAAYSAAIAELFRHIYDKERDEDEVIALTMLADFGGNMLGGLPVIKEAYSRLTDGFGIENYSLSMLNDLLDSTVRVFSIGEEFIKGGGSPQKIASAGKNLVFTAGQFTGIPVRNLYNTVYGLVKRFSPEAGYTVDSWFYEKNYQNDLYRAVEEGDERMTNMLLSLAAKERIGEVWSEPVHAEMLRLSTAGYKILPREVGETLTVDGEEYAMTDEEREMVREAYEKRLDEIEKLIKNRFYEQLDDEKRAEAIKAYYTTAYNAAISEVYGIDRGNTAMLEGVIGSDVLTILSIKTKGFESDKDKNGKTVSGSKRKKTIAAINSLSLTAEKKLLLICSKGYSLADGDVRGLTAEQAQKRLLKYIISMPGKTKEERARIAEMCGFAVKNGKILLKNTA